MWTLLGWLSLSHLPQDWPRESWDVVLVRFFRYQYQQLANVSIGWTTMGALMHFRPNKGRPAARVLSRSSRALRGWATVAPGKSREPMPWMMLFGVLDDLVKNNLPWMAVALALAFTTYMRPSEYRLMLSYQVTAPINNAGHRYGWWTVSVKPEQDGVPRKTEEFDHSIALDQPEIQWLGSCLRLRKTGRGAREPLWGFGYLELGEAFREILERLGYGQFGSSLYRLRRGGASHDQITRFRPPRERPRKEETGSATTASRGTRSRQNVQESSQH